MLLRNFFRLALAICIALPAIGSAKNVDLTGRDLIFAVSTEGILSGTLDTRFLPAEQGRGVYAPIEGKLAAVPVQKARVCVP